MDNWERGRYGESKVRALLKKHGYRFMQADILANIKGEWRILEVKYQEKFEPPPFEGHGLPRWQVDARLKFQEETGIRAMLYVVDNPSDIIYWQYLDKLMNGETYQTEGSNPRIIFPLKSFNKYKDGNNGLDSDR